MSQIKIIVNVLDDQAHWLELIKESFIDEPEYEVQYFESPNDFFSNFNKKVDLVITDVRIPNYDVLHTVKTIRTIHPGCYTIVMSAYFDVAMVTELLRLRVDDVVTKTESIEWITDLKSSVKKLTPSIIEKIKLLK
jgi:two-component system, NtrC family, response regulator HydG